MVVYAHGISDSMYAIMLIWAYITNMSSYTSVGWCVYEFRGVKVIFMGQEGCVFELHRRIKLFHSPSPSSR